MGKFGDDLIKSMKEAIKIASGDGGGLAQGEKWDDLIDKANIEHRKHTMNAMQSRGWIRRIELAFARVYAWISDEATDARKGGDNG